MTRAAGNIKSGDLWSQWFARRRAINMRSQPYEHGGPRPRQINWSGGLSNTQRYMLGQLGAANTGALPTDVPTAPPGGGGGTPRLGGGGGGGGGAAMDPNAMINSQFDRALAQLNQLVGNARIDITNEGTSVGKKLAALKRDEARQGRSIGADINAVYKKQGAMDAADLKAALADLAMQGADASTVKAVASQARADLGEEGARQGTLQKRMQQVLGSTLADRIASAATVTSGTKQELSSKQALLASQIEDQRQQALAEAAMAAAAAARGGGGGGRGGGGGGGGTPRPLSTSLSSLTGLFSKGGALPIDYAGLIGRLGIDWNRRDKEGNLYVNPNERQTLLQIAGSLQAGSPLAAQIAHWNDFTGSHQGSWGSYNPGDISNYLQLVAQQQAQQRAQADAARRIWEAYNSANPGRIG